MEHNCLLGYNELNRLLTTLNALVQAMGVSKTAVLPAQTLS